ncbi:Plasmodium exported protein, unknown function [Plasmodium ovale curtisi]|nr:Plasmodium exported protein, unknown function [Plasmodium ovale curtisi]SBT02813.1 Plasmodium exported protein, unknown function [Plasmodium ovale curtisi]
MSQCSIDNYSVTKYNDEGIYTGKTVHLRYKRILIEDAKVHARGANDEKVKLSDITTVENEKRIEIKNDLKTRATANQNVGNKMSRKVEHQKKTKGRLNGKRINGNCNKCKENISNGKHDFINPCFFAKLIYNEPQKGLDILMLYVGAFLKYSCKHCC